MNNYVIFTDSACDLTANILHSWNIRYVNLSFTFDGEETEYKNNELTPSEFYKKMRDGKSARTSAVNVEDFKTAFIKELEKGNDIIYIAFSSGLSTTFNSGRIAANELSEDYPERKIIAIDSLCASAGFGMMLYLAKQKRDEGFTIEELIAFVENTRLQICHWFTVDDLVYLKRGGRVSPTAAFVGNLLGIKPVLYMDNEGHLIPVSKVRGRRTAIVAMADKYTEKATDKENGTVFISHSACEADAKLLADILKERHGVEVKIITDVGPVIGAHAGPGTLALFFVADAR